MLNNTNSCGDTESSEHVQDGVTGLIKSFTFSIWVQVHSLSIGGFARQNGANNVSTFGKVN